MDASRSPDARNSKRLKLDSYIDGKDDGAEKEEGPQTPPTADVKGSLTQPPRKDSAIDDPSHVYLEKLEFVDQEGEPSDFKSLELGGVAHELGTVPMPMGRNLSKPYCVDSDLKLRGREGVYVCDLSVFPISPEANPTLTLAALSLRLSRHLLPRLDAEVTALDVDGVHVVNHSGEKSRAWLPNHTRTSTQDAGEKGFELKPGQKARWTRKNGVREAALVYRCDQTECRKYVKVLELFVAQSGKVLAVV
ncbi:hypothetical protein FRC04_002536 [Tulasnella sp. 424]|nr:hypothetical protein FRC04_002536 [Tulasnella sp. 424]KAG8967263.1 hypothetical protein FRC05_002109 [Tulasnella sp. 425]